MIVSVPDSFAESIRQKRLVLLSVLSIFCFSAALLNDQSIAYAGYPLIFSIIVILATYKLPISYNISRKGIWLTSHNSFLAAVLTIATNFWVSWHFDRVTEVEHTHYMSNPAILIRSRFNKRGSIIPIDRSNADALADYLRSIVPERNDANAFS